MKLRPSFLSLPVSVFSQSSGSLAMSHLIPLFPNIRGGPTVWSPDHGCAQSWPGLNGHSLIDDIKKDVSYVSSLFLNPACLVLRAIKENSSLKCFQFSRYCKSLSKVTQTNDTELSSKNILKQNTVWSNITRHGREESLKFKILSLLFLQISSRAYLFWL